MEESYEEMEGYEVEEGVEEEESVKEVAKIRSAVSDTDRGLEAFGTQDADEVQVVEAETWSPSRANSMFYVMGDESKKTFGGSLGHDSPIILITHENIPLAAINTMKSKFRLLFIEKGDSQETILEKACGVDAILHVGYNLKIDREMLDFIGKKLVVVSLMRSGYNHVDVRELTRRKIKVGNTRWIQCDSVAEVALALALTVAHRFKEGYQCCTKGKWMTEQPDWLVGKQLSGSTCGIVGFNEVGFAIAKRLGHFYVKTIMYSGQGQKRAAKTCAADFVDFSVLLSECDFIFIACPLTYETLNLFNYAAFKQMRPTCVLVNVGRGGVIKTDDLVKALREKLLWGAGLDVTDPEPLPVDHPLLHLPNCFVSAHVGSATYATREAMGVLAAENVVAALEGRPMPSPVCFKPDPVGVSFLSYTTRELTRTPAKHEINISTHGVQPF